MLVEIGGKCSSVIIYFLSDLHNRNENRRLLHKERIFNLKDLFLKVSSLITFRDLKAASKVMETKM